MKIVIATPLYPPEIGGPATYAKILMEGLPAYGIKPVLVKFSEVRHLPKLLRHYAYYRKVRTAARDADAILALDPVSVGLPAMKAAKKLGKRFILKIGGDYAWEQGKQRFGVTQELDDFVRAPRASFLVRRLQKIQTEVARAADRVIVPSWYLQSILVHQWGIPKEKVAVVYNAVTLGDIGSARAVAGVPRPFLAFVGRLVPWKRVDAVIDALEEVPKFSLAIVGDGPERARLEAHAKERLGARALFTGQLSHADALAVMKESAALVLYSSYEGLSHVLIEAQALGVPAIVSDAGGNPEIVTDQKNGLIVRGSQSLENVLNDFAHMEFPHFRMQALENAKRFSEPAMLEATVALLTSL